MEIHEMTTHLQDRVEKAIQQAPHLNRQSLRFEAQEGHVTLRGTVGSYFHKQMAQEAVRHVDGVNVISNELQVCWT
jgi:osmotically-inducible protein OsmY